MFTTNIIDRYYYVLFTLGNIIGVFVVGAIHPALAGPYYIGAVREPPLQSCLPAGRSNGVSPVRD